MFKKQETKKSENPRVETRPLDERIESIRLECEAFIEKKVAQMKAESPSVPEVVLRNLIEVRHPGNPFQQALDLLHA